MVLQFAPAAYVMGCQAIGVTPAVMYGAPMVAGGVLGAGVEVLGSTAANTVTYAVNSAMSAAAAPMAGAAAQGAAAGTELVAPGAVVATEAAAAGAEGGANGVAGALAGAAAAGRTVEVGAEAAAATAATVAKVAGVTGGVLGAGVGVFQVGMAINGLVNGPQIEHNTQKIIEACESSLRASNMPKAVEASLREVVRECKALKEEIVEHYRATNGVNIGAGVAGIGAGVCFILAPFTAGSTALIGGAICAGVGLAATSSTLLADHIFSNHHSRLQQASSRLDAQLASWVGRMIQVDGNSVKTRLGWGGSWETFKFEQAPNNPDCVGLRFSNGGKCLQVNPSGDLAASDNLLEWESWEVVPVSRSRFALRCVAHDRKYYLQVTPAGEAKTRVGHGGCWEEFEVQATPDHGFALKSCSN